MFVLGGAKPQQRWSQSYYTTNWAVKSGKLVWYYHKKNTGFDSALCLKDNKKRCSFLNSKIDSSLELCYVSHFILLPSLDETTVCDSQTDSKYLSNMVNIVSGK